MAGEMLMEYGKRTGETPERMMQLLDNSYKSVCAKQSAQRQKVMSARLALAMSVPWTNGYGEVTDVGVDWLMRHPKVVTLIKDAVEIITEAPSDSDAVQLLYCMPLLRRLRPEDRLRMIESTVQRPLPSDDSWVGAAVEAGVDQRALAAVLVKRIVRQFPASAGRQTLAHRFVCGDGYSYEFVDFRQRSCNTAAWEASGFNPLWDVLSDQQIVQCAFACHDIVPGGLFVSSNGKPSLFLRVESHLLSEKREAAQRELNRTYLVHAFERWLKQRDSLLDVTFEAFDLLETDQKIRLLKQFEGCSADVLIGMAAKSGSDSLLKAFTRPLADQYKTHAAFMAAANKAVASYKITHANDLLRQVKKHLS